MKITSALSAVAIAGMLVVTADYATMAATGGGFILGKSNFANQSTKLTNTGLGPVLKLSTTHPGTRAPLGVNSSVRVANLNADKVDGKHANQLGVRTRVFETPLSSDVATSSINVTVPDVAPGQYLATYSSFIYPSVTTATVWCWITDETFTQFTASDTGGGADSTAAMSGVGYVKLSATADLIFACSFSDPSTYSTFDGVQVTLTKIDTKTGTSTPRQAARPGPIG
jgi:hypothetical protein